MSCSRCFHVLVCVVIAACAQPSTDMLSAETALKPTLKEGVSFSFIVIGDTPYSPQDDAMLEQALPRMRLIKAPFAVHLGDYKGGGEVCSSALDDKQRRIVRSLAPKAVFYTPGDNEWTDCDRAINPLTQRPYSELERLNFVREDMLFDTSKAPPELEAEQQNRQRENASWAYQNVRFLTLHIVGTNNGFDEVTGDDLTRATDLIMARQAANLEWLKHGFERAAKEAAAAVIIIMHADPTNINAGGQGRDCITATAKAEQPCDAFLGFRKALRGHARVFKKPVLLIHGDTGPFTFDKHLAGQGAENLWRLNAAGDAGPGYGVRDVTKVEVSLGAAPPFRATGLLSGAAPDAQ
ncbi:MAG: hypothetical protein AAF862_04185 [Pseudomonadota bacterium]